jgi:hypothetical protein
MRIKNDERGGVELYLRSVSVNKKGGNRFIYPISATASALWSGAR